MTQERTKLDWALELASRGLLVFPLRPNSKEPFAGYSWLKVATCDPIKIAEWFASEPAINFGVCPGERAVVVDLDCKGNDGVSAFAALEMEFGAADTFAVDTPSGGKHLYYAVAEAAGNAHGFPPGIDVRGAHGYVVGPGCELNGKTWTVSADAPLAEAPEWIRTRLQAKADKSEDAHEALFELDLPESVQRARGFLKSTPVAVSGENGNDWTYKTIQQLRDFGISQEKAHEILTEDDGWNDRCEPPWSEEELRTITRNAYEYAQRPMGSKGGALAAFAGYDSEDVADLPPDPVAAADSKGLDAITFRGMDVTRRGPAPDMPIPDWMLAYGYHALLAMRGKGKSTILVDLACRFACDMDWHGTPMDAGWAVVYLAGEADRGVEKLIRAWCDEHEKELPADRFVFMAGIVNLLSADSTKQWTDHLRKIFAGRRCIVIADTWQRATAGASQNDDEDMQIAVQHIEAMARSLNGPALVAFHPPKNAVNATIMGSGVIENATSAIWTLDEHALGRKLTCTRIKEAAEGQYQLFRFEVVKLKNEAGEIEVDRYGRDLTGVVPWRVGGVEQVKPDPEAKEAQARENLRAKAAIAEVIRTLNAHRQDPTFTDKPKDEPLSVNRAAEQIAALPTLANEVKGEGGPPTERAEMAAEMVTKLREVGYRGFSLKTIADNLKDLFARPGASGHSFDDNTVLNLTGAGKRRYFTIQQEVG